MNNEPPSPGGRPQHGRKLRRSRPARPDPGQRLRVNPIACQAHGLCVELLPELISADPWGYPVIAAGPVPADLLPLARKAVNSCPKLALTLADWEGAPRPEQSAAGGLGGGVCPPEKHGAPRPEQSAAGGEGGVEFPR
jgi:ferredoxin